MRILVVEDEKGVSRFIQKGLKENGYSVDAAHDGEEGLHLATYEPYDLVVLDIMLPKLDGLALVKEMRNKGVRVPVIFLTARDSVKDIVQALDTGGDDYMVKPFSFNELLARIRALLRRGSLEKPVQLKVADLVLDPVGREVTRAGQSLTLTPKEFALLEYLMRHAGQVLTRTMISENIWDYHFDSGTNVVDVHINHLRSKIDAPFEEKLIHTVRGVGYVVKEAD